MKNIIRLFLFILLGLSSIPSSAYAAPTFYADRPTFEAALTTVVTDNYSPALGYPAGFTVNTNAAMSGFFNETDYQSTGFANWNILSGETYCAGCNGSFRLIFTSTSVTDSGIGVFGAGLDILFNSPALPYFAYITYGDATTESVALPAGSSFFGVTAPELIQSIHFGLTGGGTTTSGSFVIDNLTIGSAPAVVLRATSTTVSCTSPVLVNEASTCTVTVTDTAGVGESAPTGTVAFSSDSSGSFGTNPCILVAQSVNSSSCTSSYTPSIGGIHNISATYSSSAVHAASNATAALGITMSAVVPTLSEWGMMIFMALAGLVSVYFLRGRRRTESC